LAMTLSFYLPQYAEIVTFLKRIEKTKLITGILRQILPQF